jgi:DNA ligase-1
LRKLRGDAAEQARIGAVPPPRPESEGEGVEAKAGPPLLLAESWDNSQDLAGWWMSEKLDGVRAYWDGRRLISRLGNTFHAPDWFLEGFPESPLDGELWIARKQFQRTVGIVRRQDRSDHWKEVSYVAFDAPAFDGPFETRLASVRDYVGRLLPPYLRAHEHSACEGVEHLRTELSRVEALGGEGLMLRRPASIYEVGRSVTLLKVKSFLDAEARVLEHLPGAGRHKGRLGALLVELAGGTKFSVGTGFSDAQRERPPAIGALITFRYQELSEGGVPRFPSFLGVRHDIAAPSELVAVAAEPVTGATTVVVSSSVRRFEAIEGGSTKFWEVARDGCEVTVRYGRIGTAGQVKAKMLSDEAAALRHIESLIQEKTGKGYAEI